MIELKYFHRNLTVAIMVLLNCAFSLKIYCENEGNYVLKICLKMNKGCDTIFTKDNRKISSQVQDVGVEVIKYKKCVNLEGPSHSILKSEVKKIVFSNGTFEDFEAGSKAAAAKIEPTINEIPLSGTVNKSNAKIKGSIMNARSVTFFMKDDGSLWRSGLMGITQNSKGNANELYVIPKQFLDLNQCQQIGNGRYDGDLNHFAALKKDGTVWAWGRNKRGQLGNGSSESSEFPIQVKSLSEIIQISVGEEFVLALKKDGTVWAWGRNKYGQLGINSIEDSNVPIKINNLEKIKYICAGRFNSFATNESGEVFAWGSNLFGDIDSTIRSNILSPVICKKMEGAVAIQNYLNEKIFLKNDGTVWAFGELTSGDKGAQKTRWVRSSVKIQNLEGIIDISQGNNFALALKSDGTVWSWGSNSYGQLGDSSVSWHASYDEYAEKKLGGSKFMAALLMSDNYVEDFFEPFGGSKGLNSFDKAIQVHGLKDVLLISAGFEVAYAVKNDGTAWAWGSNYYGQLGIGTTRPKYCNEPKKVNLIIR